ncbi:MAG: tripartite tricarboxylate transporter substrate binding protein [Alphaproteobacteria bacterium]|nr:tripartite tricarboxylate transporter substrate binding protein [Alphaproteobacteria bacterium]
MLRQTFLRGLPGLALLGAAGPAHAQFPGSAAISLVMPYPPGGLGDYLARLVAKNLGEELGVSVVVENKPGANGAIGATVVAKARPDGHTLLCVPASTLTSNPWLMKNVGYDPLKDFTPLARLIEFPNVLMVTPDFPARTVQELIDVARRKPGSVNYGSVGVGSSTHLQAEMFKRAAGIDVVNITYKGSAPALQDLVAGQVQMMFDNLPSAFPLISGGKVRALAVTGARSSPVLPDVPTVASALPGFVEVTWWAILAPPGLPADVAAKLSDSLQKIARQPDFVKLMGDRGGVIVAGGPDDLRAAIQSEAEKTGQLIKDLGITAQ